MSMKELDVFFAILKAFHEHPNKEYSLNQIAYLVLGKGNPQNAAIVGKIIFKFKKYFKNSGL